MTRPTATDNTSQVTPDIRITVEVKHLVSHSTPGRQVFTYLVQIVNHTDDPWQLLTRHWDIVDGTGRQVSIDGEGVVGEQPTIMPGHSFVYDSFVPLFTTPGRMSGHYLMKRDDGVQAQVPVPMFALELPGPKWLN